MKLKNKIIRIEDLELGDYKETPENAQFDKEAIDFFKRQNGKVWVEEKLKEVEKGVWKWKQ